MKALRLSKKWWVLAAIGFLLVLVILKILLVLNGKPKVTVNYVAEYNRITRPENYDPNDNAAPYYQKAFDVFVEMPKGLRNPYINWPADFNSTEQAKLEEWLASNSQAFEYLKIAANRPYYWLKRHSPQDNNISGVLVTELNPLRHLIKALSWNAKLAASRGRPIAAFDNILECYRAGRQKYRTPSFLVDQVVGMDGKEIAAESALIILDNTHFDSSDLKIFQDKLQEEFDDDSYVPDFTVRKLSLYDALQRSFVYNSRGTGRLAVDESFAEMTNFDRKVRLYYDCFFGPTRNQIACQIEKATAISKQIMTKTPWQIKNEGLDYFEEIAEIKGSNFFFECFLLEPDSIFHTYYKTRAQTEALIAVVAILRFEADNHRFPKSLKELVSAGYLESVPADPYSDGPLVYKPTEDNFKIYSVGRNFSDDDGSDEPAMKQVLGLRGTYTSSCGYPLDIVYWPHKDLMKLRSEEMAAKGTETLKKIKELDQVK